MRRAVSNASAAAIVAVLVLAGLFVLYEFQPAIFTDFNTPSLSSSLSTVSAVTSSATASLTTSVSSSATSSSASTSSVSGQGPPLIVNGSFTLTYPSDYSTLSEYLLEQINQDRANFSLSSVVLSPIDSAQQHADSMLYYGYFSHWDTQGYKPYMRYTLMGGVGSVTENIAFESTSLPHFTTLSSVENALYGLEYSMMYNDSLCCQNGHRDNILDPLHNRVSIGIAYNTTRVYLVEDFENLYINFTSPFLGAGNDVQLVGSSSTNLSGIQVLVYYDPTPQPLTASQLANPPYSGEYTAGTFLGGVVPPCLLTCSTYENGITVNAKTWDVTSDGLDIVFPLGSFSQQNGAGVYTVYIEQGSRPEILFDTSFFLSS